MSNIDGFSDLFYTYGFSREKYSTGEDQVQQLVFQKQNAFQSGLIFLCL